MGQLLQRFADVKAGRGRVKERPAYNPYGLTLRVGGIRIAGVAVGVETKAKGTAVVEYTSGDRFRCSRSEAAKLVRAIRSQVSLLMQRADYGIVQRTGEQSAAQADYHRATCADRVVCCWLANRGKGTPVAGVARWRVFPGGPSIKILPQRAGAVLVDNGTQTPITRADAAKLIHAIRAGLRKAELDRQCGCQLKLVADSPQTLRACDLVRMLESLPVADQDGFRVTRGQMADFIREQRPDLVNRVDATMAELAAEEASTADTAKPVPVRYGLTYRPASFPRSFGEWRLIERGRLGSYPLRTDLPEGTFPHGVVEFDAPLPAATVSNFDLTPLE